MSRQLDVAPAAARRRRPASRSASAVRTAAATSAASRSRSSAALVPCRCARRPRARATGGPAGRVRAVRACSGWYARLASPGAAMMSGPNTVVDPVQDRRAGAEVGVEHDRLADVLLGAQVRGDVGPAEPVDRLLRVADDEQRAGRHATSGQSGASAPRATGDPHGQLDLDRVGVLELVQQQPLVPLLQRGPHGRVVPGCAAGRGPAPAGRGTPAGPRPGGPGIVQTVAGRPSGPAGAGPRRARRSRSVAGGRDEPRGRLRARLRPWHGPVAPSGRSCQLRGRGTRSARSAGSGRPGASASRSAQSPSAATTCGSNWSLVVACSASAVRGQPRAPRRPARSTSIGGSGRRRRRRAPGRRSGPSRW